MAADYRTLQQQFRSKTTDVVLAAADNGKDNIIAPRSTSYTLYIQKISYNPVTAAAQAVTFQDDNSSPLKIAVVPASQASPIVFDFGPKGVALTEGKNLDISNTAGPAALVHVEAYEKLTAAVAAGPTN